MRTVTLGHAAISLQHEPDPKLGTHLIDVAVALAGWPVKTRSFAACVGVLIFQLAELAPAWLFSNRTRRSVLRVRGFIWRNE